MTRVLLTWELGMNLGHLTRLLPVAERLKAAGHSVLVATRDVQAAVPVLGPAGIAFVQAPCLPKGLALEHRPTGYADVLLSQGWSDSAALWGLTQAWLNLIRLFRPDQLLMDYSPTAALAARVAGVPGVMIGNGFEMPPATHPLPPFPGFAWAEPAKSAESEHKALANANGVLTRLGCAPLTALCELFLHQRQLFTTYRELDHYGARADARYVGPLLGKLKTPRTSWPRGRGPKIFACLRPDTHQVDKILMALTTLSARVVCVAAGFPLARIESLERPHIQFALVPLDLEALSDADLCISYGAEGTIMRLLSAGVPQLISPWHVETFLAARRIEEHGLGLTCRFVPGKSTIEEAIARLTHDGSFRARTRAFAQSTLTTRTPDATSAVIEALRIHEAVAA
jgi:UDP:flavonoid glycosyltransferase YjiC (YdhE family)